MATITTEQAAQKICEAETTALSKLRDLLNKLDTDLKTISDELSYPVNFRSDAVRIISELRGQQEYRRTSEIPNLITMLSPPAEGPMPPPVV